MPLGDFVTNVITRFKADTSDMKRQIRSLRGEQKKLAKAQLDDLEKENRKIDEQIGRWAKLTAGVLAAREAYQAVTASVNTFVETQRLRNASAEADIQRLQDASEGLVSKFDLMRLAAQNLNSDFRLTQTQMDGVAAGMAGLIRQGRDSQLVLDRVGDAIREGNVEPLKEFGIVIKGVENDTAEAADTIARRLREMGAGGEQAIDGIVRSQVDLKDATTELKEAFGEMAVQLVPVVDLLTQMIRDTRSFIRDLSDFGEFMLTGELGSGSGLSLIRSGLRQMDVNRFVSQGAGVLGFAGLDDAIIAQTEQFRRDATTLIRDVRNIASAQRSFRGRGGGGRAPRDVAVDTGVDRAGVSIDRRQFGGAPLDLGFGGAVGRQEFEAGLDRARAGRGVTPDTSPMRNVEDMASAALESSEAFGLFRQSATNAFGAIIQGGAGVSKALRKFLGDIILGKAFDAFTDALLASGKALIFAFTPGAQGNAIAAAKAAAANFAIAATLGGIAKRFGASGSLPGGGGRGRADIGPVTNTRGVGTGGDRGDTFIFAGGVESEIERARKFRRAQRRAVESTDDGPALLEAS